jgi:hypothetical protein
MINFKTEYVKICMVQFFTFCIKEFPRLLTPFQKVFGKGPSPLNDECQAMVICAPITVLCIVVCE